MSVAESIAGQWVRDEDMNPFVNIAGRKFWARGDIEGTYNGYWPTHDGLKPRGLWWHFTPEQCRDGAQEGDG